jgi:hypothetical protein
MLPSSAARAQSDALPPAFMPAETVQDVTRRPEVTTIGDFSATRS